MKSGTKSLCNTTHVLCSFHAVSTLGRTKLMNTLKWRCDVARVTLTVSFFLVLPAAASHLHYAGENACFLVDFSTIN